jgi:hypothetical protein
MHSEPTQNHLAGNLFRRITTLTLFVMLLSACAPAAVDRPIPTPTATVPPTATADSSVATFEPTPAIGTRQRIERVTLATRIDGDGAPVDETTVVSEWPEMIYLCVLMSAIEHDTRLRAYWFQGNDIIAQSDMSPPATNGEPAWVALRYRPVAKLNPAAEYSVELRLGDDLIDRYLFRVGVGDPTDAIAEIAFASGFDEHGKPRDIRRIFAPQEASLTLRMRISNQVDPIGMVFTSLWYRGDARIARVEGSLMPAEEGGEPDRRRIEFTYTPSAPLALGIYRVDVLLNGVPVRTVRFEVSTVPEPPTPTPVPEPTPEPPPTETPEPSPTATLEPTPSPSPSPSPSPVVVATPAPSVADVRDVTLATLIDDASRAPLNGPIFTLDRPAGSLVDLWVAIFVTNLTTNDLVEVIVLQNDSFYGSVPVQRVTRASGWIATDVHLDAPSSGGAFVYTIQVVLNGQRTLASSCQIRAA